MDSLMHNLDDQQAERERQEQNERITRFSQAETDPCTCRKAGESTEDCPWKCPAYRPEKWKVERLSALLAVVEYDV